MSAGAGRRSPRRWSPSGWSLRVRLVGLVSVLMLAGLLVTGTVGITLLRSYLINQVDSQLDALTQRGPFGGPGGQFGGQPPVSSNQSNQSNQSDQQLPTPFVFTLLNANGTVVSQLGGSSSGHTSRPVLTGLTAAVVTQRAGHPFTVPASGGGSDFRVVALRNSNGTSTVVGLSLRSSDATVHRLEHITLISAVVVLVLLIGLATVLVRIGLRPLRAVEQTAQRISGRDLSGGDLAERVPVLHPNTEVGRLSATLNVMLGQIESAFADRTRSEQTLRQFIADASHELRTPLTTVRGYAEVVNRGALADEQERRHALQRIEAEAARMSILVDDLLLLAYLDQQRPLQTVRVDLVPLVLDAVSDARARAPQRQITGETGDTPAVVEVDVDRMRQVLGNLISNALVHTPAEAAVAVAVQARGRQAVLTVTDTGPGIGPESLGRLFERFYRADPGRSRSRGGTGLGLAIVAAVVAASGGSVRCESEPGHGATFTVTLPLAG